MRYLRPATALSAVLLLLCALAALSLPIAAQNADNQESSAPPTPPKLETPAPENEETATEPEANDIVKIEHADLLQYEADKEMYYLSGSVAFSHEDMKMYCDEAWYDEANDTARAIGHLRIVDPEATITGDLAAVNFDTEVATLTGNITVVAQKKVEEAESSGDGEEKPTKFEEYRRKKTTITCPKIVYEYNDNVKKMTLSGPIKAVQEDKTAWAEAAVYEELTDIITLTGNVRVTTKKGEEFRAPEVVISVEEEWMKAKDVSGITFRRRDENE